MALDVSKINFQDTSHSSIPATPFEWVERGYNEWTVFTELLGPHPVSNTYIGVVHYLHKGLMAFKKHYWRDKAGRCHTASAGDWEERVPRRYRNKAVMIDFKIAHREFESPDADECRAFFTCEETLTVLEDALRTFYKDKNRLPKIESHIGEVDKLAILD